MARNGKRQPPTTNGSPVHAAIDGRRKVAHDVKNTLAALRLRLHVVNSDPTCRWAQEENLTAIMRLIDEAIGAVDELGSAETPVRAPSSRDEPSRA
jgi:hypothetical protein